MRRLRALLRPRAPRTFIASIVVLVVLSGALWKFALPQALVWSVQREAARLNLHVDIDSHELQWGNGHVVFSGVRLRDASNILLRVERVLIHVDVWAMLQGAQLIPTVVARDGQVNERRILDYLTMVARADRPDETAHAPDYLPPWALARTLRLERITLAALSQILGRDTVVDSLAISTTSPVQGTHSPAVEATVRIGTGRVHLEGTIPASSLLAGTPGGSLNGTVHTTQFPLTALAQVVGQRVSALQGTLNATAPIQIAYFGPTGPDVSGEKTPNNSAARIEALLKITGAVRKFSSHIAPRATLTTDAQLRGTLTVEVAHGAINSGFEGTVDSTNLDIAFHDADKQAQSHLSSNDVQWRGFVELAPMFRVDGDVGAPYVHIRNGRAAPLTTLEIADARATTKGDPLHAKGVVISQIRVGHGVLRRAQYVTHIDDAVLDQLFLGWDGEMASEQVRASTVTTTWGEGDTYQSHARDVRINGIDVSPDGVIRASSVKVALGHHANPAARVEMGPTQLTALSVREALNVGGATITKLTIASPAGPTIELTDLHARGGVLVDDRLSIVQGTATTANFTASEGTAEGRGWRAHTLQLDHVDARENHLGAVLVSAQTITGTNNEIPWVRANRVLVQGAQIARALDQVRLGESQPTATRAAGSMALSGTAKRVTVQTIAFPSKDNTGLAQLRADTVRVSGQTLAIDEFRTQMRLARRWETVHGSGSAAVLARGASYDANDNVLRAQSIQLSEHRATITRYEHRPSVTSTAPTRWPGFVAEEVVLAGPSDVELIDARAQPPKHMAITALTGHIGPVSTREPGPASFALDVKTDGGARISTSGTIQMRPEFHLQGNIHTRGPATEVLGRHADAFIAHGLALGEMILAMDYALDSKKWTATLRAQLTRPTLIDGLSGTPIARGLTPRAPTSTSTPNLALTATSGSALRPFSRLAPVWASTPQTTKTLGPDSLTLATALAVQANANGAVSLLVPATGTWSGQTRPFAGLESLLEALRRAGIAKIHSDANAKIRSLQASFLALPTAKNAGRPASEALLFAIAWAAKAPNPFALPAVIARALNNHRHWAVMLCPAKIPTLGEQTSGAKAIDLSAFFLHAGAQSHQVIVECAKAPSVPLNSLVPLAIPLAIQIPALTTSVEYAPSAK
ncbi:MAG: hypothetical protein ACI8PT_002826 [Gammaproteobacteria bacterium]|jgi:hypothetical protein